MSDLQFNLFAMTSVYPVVDIIHDGYKKYPRRVFGDGIPAATLWAECIHRIINTSMGLSQGSFISSIVAIFFAVTRKIYRCIREHFPLASSQHPQPKSSPLSQNQNLYGIFTAGGSQRSWDENDIKARGNNMIWASGSLRVEICTFILNLEELSDTLRRTVRILAESAPPPFNRSWVPSPQESQQMVMVWKFG
jgi:hypothetical protein